MKNYKVLNPINYGERQERGSIVSMSEEVARAFDSNDIQEIETIAPESAPVTTGENVEDEVVVQPAKRAKPKKK